MILYQVKWKCHPNFSEDNRFPSEVNSDKMAPRMAAVLRAPGKHCSFSYVLFVFFCCFAC